MFCGEQSILATSHFGQIAALVKCKRWGCPNCQEWRQRCLMARCIEGNPNRFLTVTCRRGQFTSPAAAAQAMTAAWRAVVLRWRREKKWRKCQYIAVFEPHESGWPHLHILWNGDWIAQRWLSAQMTQLLNSPVVHVSRIKGVKSAAFYVAKYFSKEPEKFGNSKRYWTSKHWPKLKHIDAQKAFHKGFPIELVNKTLSEVIKTWEHFRKTVWHRPPDIYGWGTLWEPSGPQNRKITPAYNHTFGFQVSNIRRKRAPRAREGGDCV